MLVRHPVCRCSLRPGFLLLSRLDGLRGGHYNGLVCQKYSIMIGADASIAVKRVDYTAPSPAPREMEPGKPRDTWSSREGQTGAPCTRDAIAQPVGRSPISTSSPQEPPPPPAKARYVEGIAQIGISAYTERERKAARPTRVEALRRLMQRKREKQRQGLSTQGPPLPVPPIPTKT